MNFELKEVLSLARMEFELNNHSIMDPYHILMGILVQPNGIGWKIFSLMDVDLGSLNDRLQHEFALKLDIIKLKDKSDIITDSEVKQILIDTSIISEDLKIDMSVETLLLGILNTENKAKELLIDYGLDELRLKNFLINTKRNEIESLYLESEKQENEKLIMGEELNELPNLTVRKSKKNELPILNSFGTNLNELAKEGKINKVFGRESELDRMMVVLMRKTKRNPLIIGEAGVGKAQPLDAKILTPSGWTTMGEIKVGDKVVTPNNSVATVTGVFPQGVKEIYKITTNDGREAEACKEHLWNLFDGKKKKDKWAVRDTEYLINELNKNNKRLGVELVNGVSFGGDQEMFISPYLLGLLIGDGSFTDTIRFTNSSEFIIEKVSSEISEHGYKLSKTNTNKKSIDYRIISEVREKSKAEKNIFTNKYKAEISSLGLLNKKSYEKFIPEKYKNTSVQNKINLIKGLMDTDGYVGVNGDLTYSTSSKQLAKDIQEILWSLGAVVKIKTKQPYYTYKGEKKEGRLSYTLSIRMKNPRELVSIPNKLERIPVDYQYSDSLKNNIISVEYSRTAEAQCIMIDSDDHLYITNDYIVTHNTALAEGLAQKIVDKDVHEYFLDKIIYTVDLPSMVAGTKFRGEFEERLKGLVKELVANPNIIIFLDELHQLIGSGSTSGGTMDGANIIKPELSRGSLQVIGATTYGEYKEHIVKDSAMARRFQNINLIEPTQEQTIEILKNAKENFESYHGVSIDNDLIEKIVKYAGRYITSKRFPDKAFDLLDEVSAFVKYNNNVLSDEQLNAKKNYHDAEAKYTETHQLLKTLISRSDFDKAAEVRDQLKKLKANTRVLNSVLEKEMSKTQTELKPTEDDLIKTVKLVTGVEVTKIDNLDINYLLTLEDKLNSKVIGQKTAIEVMSQGIIRKKTGIKDPNKPLVYLFLGQTGVGKTLLVKEIAKEVYGSESKFIRINMSDYQDSYTVSNITGSAKGYVGSETGSFLYEKIKHNPDSIILLDEVEKAHTNVFNAFLQIFDEGQAVTNDGEVISFKESIIVMTSNLGVKEVSESQKTLSLYQSDNSSDQRATEAYDKALKAKFSPEVLNRITKIVTFNPIKKENAIDIAKIEVQKLINRVESIGKKLKVKKSAYDFLAENGFSKEYGARFLNRTIEQELEIPLSYYILKNPEQETISVEIKSGKIIFK